MEQVTTTENFFDVSKSIVEKFIQSVVAVDDGMVFDSRPIVDAAEELDQPDDDGLGLGFDVESTTEDGSLLSSVGEHCLYYQDLSSSFAQKGIICSGFTPLNDQELTARSILESSKNADITILDWQMDKGLEQGTLATDAIKRIIESDIAEGGRLRLITIYTAENIQRVLDRLQGHLKVYNSLLKEDHIVFTKDELRFCKIDIVSKDTTEAELTDKVIVSLTHLTAGLLSNAALSAITDTRNRTHNILYKFNRELDPAYLSHVLGLISSPDMREQAHEVAFDYAVELISEEIKSELQISQIVKDSLSSDILKLWPDHVNDERNESFFGLKVGTIKEVKFNTSRMESLLTIATEEQLKENLELEPKIADGEQDGTNKKDALKVFRDSNIQLVAGVDSTSQHLELSAIQSVRRDAKTNGEHIPVMKQGTVVKKGNEYYVCIQPLCDSVRLKEDTNFTFLRISKVSNSKPFSHVMRSDSGHMRLCIQPSSKRINVFRFKPCHESRVVKANQTGKNFSFKESLYGIDFEWCGEFKQAVSQEIVNNVTANMARVGLDSFEWLRLKSR